MRLLVLRPNSLPHPKPLDDFEIMDCIDAGLNRFGPGIKYAVYWTSVVMSNSKTDGILTHPENFVAALQKIFGKSATQIETTICREIQVKAGPAFNASTLPTLIAQIRAQRMMIHSLA
jgi:hypothetical protein